MPLEELHLHVSEFVEQVGVRIDIQTADDRVLVVLRDVSLPSGAYAVATTDVLFLTDAQYPLSAMDMFWTDPAVLRPDGSVPLNADSIELYAGRSWRRFSWHRNGVWNSAGNPLLDHFEFTQARFAQDVAR